MLLYGWAYCIALLQGLVLVASAESENRTQWITFAAENAVAIEDKTVVVLYNLTWCSSTAAVLTVSSVHPRIAEIVANGTVILPANGDDGGDGNCSEIVRGSFEVLGKRLGRAKLNIGIEKYIIDVSGEDSQTYNLSGNHGYFSNHSMEYDLVVLRTQGDYLLDTIVIGLIMGLSVLFTFIMGCEIDIQAVIEILKKPTAALIGLSCQFLIMPLVSFSISKLLPMEGVFSLGLFCLGSSPGGGGSNMWTILFGGEIDLSITMTLLSTLAAFGTMPLWMYTLGTQFDVPVNVQVPFVNIFSTLCLVSIPCAVGMLLHKYRPQWAKKISKSVKPAAFIMVATSLCAGCYSNRYMFRIMFSEWYILPSCIGQPWIAALLAYGAARLLKQAHRRAITIAIETGIQNIGVPIILLKFSLVRPEGDVASTMPITAAIFATQPLYVAFAVKTIRDCRKKRREQKMSVELKDMKKGKVDANENDETKETFLCDEHNA